jgi:two-component system, LuxR family, sensor kinase FixL
MVTRSTKSSGKTLFVIGMAAVAYFAFGRLAVHLAIPPGIATHVFPASGIALTAILKFGYRAAAGVFLGSFALNIGTLWSIEEITVVNAILVTMYIAFGSTGQALLGTMAIQRFTGTIAPFESTHNVFRFLLIVSLCCLVAPTLGATGLCFGGYITWDRIPNTWWTWWIGDFLGVLVMTPLILSWWVPRWTPTETRHWAEPAALAVILVCLSQLIFGVPLVFLEGPGFPFVYLLTAPVIWAAFRFYQRGVTITVLMVATAVLWGTILRRGPFVADSVAESLLMMQVFMGVVAAIGLVLAAAQTEQVRTANALRQSSERLEMCVLERTAALATSNTALNAEVQDRRKTEQSLRLSELRLRLLVEGVEDHAIFMLDPDGNVATWNNGAERIHGYRAEEIIGKNFSCFYPPDLIEQGLPERHLMAARNNDRLEDEGWQVRKNGNQFWAKRVIMALKDDQDQLQGFSEITHDLSERKLAEERFGSLLESAPDAMVIMDEQGKIVLVNAQAERLFGYTRTELLGQHVERLVPGFIRHNHDDSKPTFLSASRRKPIGAGLELHGLRKDGSEVAVEISVSPLQTRDGVLVSSAIRDITARKRIQEALRKSERLAAIGETITGLAHESRNALQRSQSCLEMLAREVEGKPKATDLIRRIQNAQDDLHQLFDAVRKYADPIVLNPRRCHLGLVVQECWDSLQYLWQRKKVTLRSEFGNVDLRCWIDPAAIGQVLRNVFENSLQACGNCAEIASYWCDAEIQNHPALTIVVRDNGPGLGPEQRAKIFDPFYSTKTRGTGLGMALAKRIVEAHDGRISVGNGEGPGTEILITLPREAIR